MVAESAPGSSAATDENYGVFSCRYGNIYTVRQLLQLFQRAYGLFEPKDSAWQRADSRFVDPFRPQIQGAGFETADHVAIDREAHFSAVRSMFEDCNVFVYTLGLTEGWESPIDGAVFPLAPGVVDSHAEARFHNFTVGEMEADLRQFLKYFWTVNPGCRVILTVSPVPLIATFEARHALVSNTYSKAALRVVADAISRESDLVDYFPSYEIITGLGNSFYAEDLREIKPEGVSCVMSIFGAHYLGGESVATVAAAVSDAAVPEDTEKLMELQQIICDEEKIEEGAFQ